MNAIGLFTEELKECENKWEEEIRLEPDKSISGALAFRLAGSRTRGVFIQYVNQKSKQSRILYKGDQILKINGSDVRRLTCDQIVNVLRLAVNNNGYVLMQVSRQLRYVDDVLWEISKDENGNLHYCYRHDLTTSSILPESLSDMTGLNESAIYAKAMKSSTFYCDDLTQKESMQLVCFSEVNKQQFSLYKKRKSTMFGYVKQAVVDDIECEFEEKCAECSKYSTKWRWHVMKHRWAINAMKILPKSASDFFGLRIYQKAYYNLI